MNVLESLAAINAYPIPQNTILSAINEAGMQPDEEATFVKREEPEYKRAKAYLYRFLAEAPNISQGGVSYSFSSTDKELFRKKAEELLMEADGNNTFSYGWDGEDF